MSTISTLEAEINTWSSSTPSDINAEDEIHRIAIKILQQSIDLLINLSNDGDKDCLYIYQSKFIPQSSIGKHIRHLCDHFRLLNESKSLMEKRILEKNNNYNYPLGDYEKEDLNCVVDYDNRMANKEIETSHLNAVKLIKRLQSVLRNDSSVIPLTFPIRVNSAIDIDLSIELNSTYGRELWFCCHHAIHHYALIKVICVELNITCPENFGIAPSTLRRYY